MTESPQGYDCFRDPNCDVEGNFMKHWFVYMVRCSDGTLYTGITRDPHERMKVHNDGKGAKYTRGRRPVYLAYSEMARDRSSALRKEAEIKRLSRKDKEKLIG